MNERIDPSQSSEIIARQIADAGPGVYPTSKLRDVIYETALPVIRALKGISSEPDLPERRG